MAEEKKEKEENKEKNKGLYLFIPDVEGPIVRKNYEGWIILDSYQWGMGLAVTQANAGRWGDQDDENQPKTRQVSHPSYSEITIVKTIDVASPQLLGIACSRRCLPFVKIVVLDEADNISMTILLKDVIISGYSLSAGRSNRLKDQSEENISLNYEVIEFHSPDFPSIGYNLSDNSVMLGGKVTTDFEGLTEDEYEVEKRNQSDKEKETVLQEKATSQEKEKDVAQEEKAVSQEKEKAMSQEKEKAMSQEKEKGASPEKERNVSQETEKNLIQEEVKDVPKEKEKDITE